MVIFWGRPAADCRFHRRSAYHLPQPSFSITAVFFVICGPCCRRQAASRGHLCRHWLSFLAATVFFCLATVRCFAGLSAAVPLLHRCVGRLLSWPPSCALFQPSRRVHDCPATPLSPPGVLLQPHLFAGLWFNNFFAAFYTFATAGCRCPGNLKPSLLPLHAATFWESC